MTGVLAHLLIQPCTITPMNVKTTNAYGDEVLSAGTPVNTTGYLYQTGSTEDLNDRDTTVSQWWCDLPAEVTITAQDQIAFNSQTFIVDGVPENLWNPRTGVYDHIECKLVVSVG